MGATCVLPSVASLTGRAVCFLCVWFISVRFGKQNFNNFNWLVLFGLGRTVKHRFGWSLHYTSLVITSFQKGLTINYRSGPTKICSGIPKKCPKDNRSLLWNLYCVRFSFSLCGWIEFLLMSFRLWNFKQAWFQIWLVLKSKIFGQISIYSMEILVFCEYDEWQFIENWTWF